MAQLTKISKSMIFGTFVCVVLALDLNFEERGGDYTEKILIDDKEGTIEYDVPQHGRVNASKYLVDFHSGYKVMKSLQRNECYVMDMPKNEPKPAEVKLALQMLNGTFPNSYFVETNNIFPLYKMEVLQLSQAILTFCGDYPIIKSISVKNAKEAEQVFVKMFRKKQRQRRSFDKFKSCTTPDFGVMTRCMSTPDKGVYQCRLLTSTTCIYNVRCHYNAIFKLVCNSKHEYTGLFCCDMIACNN